MIGPIPDDLKASIDRYVEHGIPTGSFLRFVLENNLSQSVAQADERNIRLIPEIVNYIYNQIPGAAWGSEAIVDAWLKMSHWERNAIVEARRKNLRPE